MDTHISYASAWSRHYYVFMELVIGKVALPGKLELERNRNNLLLKNKQ